MFEDGTKYTVKQYREYAREQGIRGYSALKKDGLIEAIKKHEASKAAPAPVQAPAPAPVQAPAPVPVATEPVAEPVKAGRAPRKTSAWDAFLRQSLKENPAGGMKACMQRKDEYKLFKETWKPE
jgi:hypothetical protein